MKKHQGTADEHVLLERVDAHGTILEPAKGAMTRSNAESLHPVLTDELSPEDKARGVGWRIRRAPRGTHMIRPRPKGRGRRGPKRS